MKTSKLGKVIVICILTIAGIILLVQSPTPAPETIVRQEAVQSAYAPNRLGNNGASSGEPTGSTIISGDPVLPVLVNINSIPHRPAEVDEMRRAYEAGEIDLDENEGPVSEAVFQALLEESKQQGVDSLVQNYDPLSEANRLNQTTGSLVAGASFKSIDYTQSLQGVPPDPDIMVGKDMMVVVFPW